VKLTDVVPAATVADPGTVRLVFVFVRVTAAPPDGAGPFKVTVQVELLELFRVPGLHDKELTDGSAPPVTVPPVAFSGIAAPEAEDATLFVTPTAVVLTPTAMVRFTTATVPFEMIPSFIPESTQL